MALKETSKTHLQQKLFRNSNIPLFLKSSCDFAESVFIKVLFQGIVHIKGDSNFSPLTSFLDILRS